MGRMKRRTQSRVRPGVLAIIAMLELLLLSVSLTFSWFERASLSAVEGKKIETDDILLSVAEVGNNQGTINLNHYFDMGDTKFAPVYSDNGLEFTSQHNISMNTGEIYAATLSFQFLVKSATDCDFWVEGLTFRLRVNDDDNAYSFSVQSNTSQRNPSANEEYIDSEESPTETDVEDLIPPESLTSGNEGVADTGTTDATTPEIEIDQANVVGETLPEPNSEDTMSTTGDSEGTQRQTESIYGNDYAKSIYIAFHDEQCCEMNTCVVVPLLASVEGETDIGDYLFTGDNVNKLFTRFASQDGIETTVRCSIWYQPTDGIMLPEGAEIEIDLLIASSWAETRTVYLMDATTMLGEMHQQMDADSYSVELVHIATGEVFSAVYDSELGIWRAEVPLAVDNFNIRYRSKDFDRKVLATWNNINGEHVHSFTLMDEGVFIKSES